MSTIKTTIKGRRLELDAPADWPDGTEVEIHALGRTEDGCGEALSPKEIARILDLMDQMQPLEMTDAELAAWDAERLGMKNREKAEFIEHAAELRKSWE